VGAPTSPVAAAPSASSAEGLTTVVAPLEALDGRLNELAEEVDAVKEGLNELTETVHSTAQDSRERSDSLEAKLDHLTRLVRLQVEERMHEASGVGSIGGRALSGR
jgi:methyl-accepting chemotaxis protein